MNPKQVAANRTRRLVADMKRPVHVSQSAPVKKETKR